MSELDPKNLNELSRDELISRAAELGVTRPELLTRVELRDEIVRLTETDEQKRQQARGWLGVARDMVASVVEQRLNLPDAADLIRGVNVRLPRNVPPVATVTLAEIYAAQGHLARAVKLLDEVLAGEPDHEAARELRERLTVEAEPQPEAVSEPPEFQETEGLSESGSASETLESQPSRDDAKVSSEFDSSPISIRYESVTMSDVPAAPTSDSLAPQVEIVSVVAAEPIDVAEPIVSESAEPQSVELESEPTRDYLIYRRHHDNVVCHWSITTACWESWSSRSDGQWVLRIIQISPAVGPLVPSETVVPLPGTTGEAMLNDVPARQQLRMALGWEAGGRFIPVSIGIEVTGNSPEDVSITWLPMPGPREPAPEVWLDFARRDWHFLTIGAAS